MFESKTPGKLMSVLCFLAGKVARKKYEDGEQFGCSCVFDDMIVAGYGSLDYAFKYPLPSDIMMKEYGTYSWKEYDLLRDIEKRNENIDKVLEGK